MRVTLLLIALALVLVAPAAAGGEQSDLSLAGNRLLVVSAAGLRELDAHGRTLWAPQPTSARYLQSVAVAGGAAWVASVLNGDTGGELERIDLATHVRRVVLRVRDGAVLYVSRGAGGVYAFVARRGPAVIVRLSDGGRVTGRWRVGDGGRMAADASGCWISGESGLRHVDASGRIQLIGGVPFGDVATGAGSVWIDADRGIVRVDERTGAVHRLHVGSLSTAGFQHDLAFGAGALWTLDLRAPSLQRRSTGTGRVLRSVRIDGRATAVAVTGSTVWVATTAAVERFNAGSLRRTLSVPLF